MFSGRSEGGGPPGFGGEEGKDDGGAPPQDSGPEDDFDDDVPLELEHMMGYTGRRLGTLLAHPRLSEVFIKSVGSAVVVGDLNDPHQQEFLRGHDMEITAMAISASGSKLASGQLGTVHHKGYGAPVIVWDLNTKRPLFTLHGHKERVDLLRFSPDERFLVGTGADCLLHIWDIQTGEVIFGKKFAKPVCLFQWCDVQAKGRRTQYEVAIGTAVELTMNDLYFDPTRQQWMVDSTVISMPTAGMTREYYCSGRSLDADELLAGSSVGDLIVFKLPSKVYRASVPVCSGGLRALVASKTAFEVFCGGGDGSVKKLNGDDMRWTLTGEATVDGAVTSLSLVASGAELLVGTDTGRVYRMLTSDLTAQLVAVGHTDKVTCVAFGSRSDVFASGTEKGDVKVWDLSDYGVLSETTVAPENGAEGGVASICWVGDEAVVTGWHDTFIRCHDASTMQCLWEIPNAHRGAVMSVAAHSDASLSYLLSGGSDGSVRVWALRSREMMLQFVEHQKAVTQVLVDVKSPNLVHSAGSDCQVLTYDLRRERRTIAHLVSCALRGGFLVTDGIFGCLTSFACAQSGLTPSRCLAVLTEHGTTPLDAGRCLHWHDSATRLGAGARHLRPEWTLAFLGLRCARTGASPAEPLPYADEVRRGVTNGTIPRHLRGFLGIHFRSINRHPPHCSGTRTQ
jgi:WD40 repeat protein